MKTRFDLEQEILDCWHITNELNLLYEQAMDRQVPLTQDQLANMLLGLYELYNLKFERTFETFEEVVS